MQETKPEQLKLDLTGSEPVKVPDEKGSIHVTEHIKIFDPNTKEVFLSKREDL